MTQTHKTERERQLLKEMETGIMRQKNCIVMHCEVDNRNTHTGASVGYVDVV